MKIHIQIMIFLQLFLFSFANSQHAEINLTSSNYSNIQVSLNDVLQFSVFSSSKKAFNGSIQVDITNGQGLTSSMLRTGNFKVQPGNNTAQQLLSQSSLNNIFFNPGFERANSRSFLFPRGNYQVCISVLNQEKGILDQACLQIEVWDSDQLLLIYPFNGEALNTLHPTFTWTPLTINRQVTTYKVKWVESEKEALNLSEFNNSLPFFTIGNLRNNIFPYTMTAPRFDNSKVYFWKVEGYRNNKMVAESEVWRFQFNQSKTTINQKIWYIDVDNNSENEIHYFQGEHIGFTVENFSHNDEVVFELTNGQSQIILSEKDITLEAMNQGKNYYSIDVSALVQDDIQYTLKINTKRKSQVVRFIKLKS